MSSKRGAAGTGTWTISNSTFAAGSTVTKSAVHAPLVRKLILRQLDILRYS